MLLILSFLLFSSQIFDTKAQRITIDNSNFALNKEKSSIQSKSIEYVYVDIDPNKIQGTYYYFDTSIYNPAKNQIIVLKLDSKYDIQRLEIYYSEFSGSFYVEIPEDYTKLTLVGLEAKYKFYDLIYHAKNLVLDCEKSCIVVFHDPRGRVEIGDNPRLAIGAVYLTSNSFTMHSNEKQQQIQLISFGRDQGNFIFEGNTAQVLDVYVSQDVHCKITNCQLSQSIEFEFGSTLEITDSVYFDHFTAMEIPFSNGKANLNSPYIKSDSLADPPSVIKVIQVKGNLSSLDSNNKIWIGQSNNKFACGKWAATISSRVANYNFNYECLKEGENAFNLYAIPYTIPEKKKKKTLAAEYIALIIVSCLCAVVIIASIIIYFVVIRPKANEHSEDEN